MDFLVPSYRVPNTSMLNCAFNFLFSLSTYFRLYRSRYSSPLQSGNTQDLKTYLRESENSEKCYRMKLMFVGKENSGKTTLLKCLMKGSSGPKSSFFKNLPQLRNDMRSSAGGPDDQQHENLSTDGIEIRDWTAK